MQPKSGSDQNTDRVEKGKDSATFKSTPLPSLGLVAILTAFGFCFLKAGFCLKEAPSPCEGFSTRMESQQAEPWQARGGQHIPLLTVKLTLELKHRRTAPLARGSWCGTEHKFWDGSCKVLGLFKDLFYWHSRCVDVHPSTSSIIFKGLLCLCLAVLSFVLFFHAVSAPRKELCPCAEPVKLTTAHPESRCSLRCAPLEQWDVNRSEGSTAWLCRLS